MTIWKVVDRRIQNLFVPNTLALKMQICSSVDVVGWFVVIRHGPSICVCEVLRCYAR